MVSQMAAATVVGLQGTLDPNGYYNFTVSTVFSPTHATHAHLYPPTPARTIYN